MPEIVYRISLFSFDCTSALELLCPDDQPSTKLDRNLETLHFQHPIRHNVVAMEGQTHDSDLANFS